LKPSLGSVNRNQISQIGRINHDPSLLPQGNDRKAGDVEFDVARIDEIEAVTKHDVIAFLTHLAEIVGDDARFVHQGIAALKKRAYEHKDTITIGRSHGIHAEPTTFGVKLAQAYAEFERCKNRLIAAREEIATCAISGAVGTFANIDPAVEEHVAKAMGLAAEPVSTQVIPRDRHAMYFATLGVIASSIERLATEVRHLQRTEVLEAEEYFSPGQKGSSAMPHKRNPVLTENLTGLANRLTGVIDKLLVYPENMMNNMNKFRGLVHSQRVLLALTQAGASREDSYRLVQRNAMKVWEEGKDFLTELLADDEVMKLLSEEEIREKFDLGYHTKHVDTIFNRVFG